MKILNITILALLLLWSTFALSQSSYYDAIKLKKLGKPPRQSGKVELQFQKVSQEELLSVLLVYLPNSITKEVEERLKELNELENKIDKDSSNAERKNWESRVRELKQLVPRIIIRELDQNPFITTSGGLEKGLSIDDVSELLKATPSLSGVTSSIGGLNVTTFADGLAKFIVERSKQELNAYFFDRFREEVESSVELGILFPQTAELLQVIGVKIYNYNTYLVGLRAAFENDLSALFVNFPQLMDHEKYESSFNEFPNLRLIIKSSFHVINQLNNNVHPGDVIHQFPKNYGRDEVPDNIYNAVQVVDVFSQSLRSQSDERYWVSQDSLRFLGDDVTFRIYLGLIYQTVSLREDPIVFSSDINSVDFKDDILKPIGEQWDQKKQEVAAFKSFIFKIGEDAEKVNISLKALKELKGSEESKHSTVYAFLDASLDLLEHTREVADLPYLSDHLNDLKPHLDTLDDYLQVCRNANELYLNASERKYGMAVSNLFSIMNEVFPEYVQKSTIENEFTKAKAELDRKYPPGAAQEEKGYKEKLDSLKKIGDEAKHFQYIGKVLKYGSFMAAVVTAETSDEVKEIIESTALPAGSSRIKKESQFNVAINSYVGLFAGHEWIKDVGNKYVVNNIGLSAPVGVSFSWGVARKNKEKPGYSLGGFFSIVDLGALASFRFEDDETAIASEINLEHILAPGLFVSCGLPKAPISINVGGQMGPLLREVTAEANTNLENVYWRVGLSVVVDIPLYNLYNREKN